MKIMSCLVIVLSIVNGFFIHSGYGQSGLTPYKLTHQELDQPNAFQLKCIDSVGLAVNDAVFFRNGALNTTDECFKGANTTGNGLMQLTLASECDGRFMCGTMGTDVNEYILSGPTTIYATPVVTSSAVVTIQAEEGQDVMVNCPFSESPLGDYQISFWSNRGGDIQLIPTTALPATPNTLTLTNVTMAENTGLHFCQLLDTTNTVYTSPNIKLQIFAKFARPMIISDLSYMVTNHDTGSTQFTIIATGTDINYQWKVNGTIYNTTLDTLVVELPQIGETAINVRVWNTKYDGTLYEEHQTMIVDRDINTVIKDDSCQPFSGSTSSGTANIVLLIILIIILLVTVLGSIIVIIIVKRVRHTKATSGCSEMPDDNSGQDNIQTVMVNNIQVEIDTKKAVEQFSKIFDQLELILILILNKENFKNRNPQVDAKIRELKYIIATFAKDPNDTQNQTGNDQVPRGPSNGEKDCLKIFLPSLGNWIQENTYKEIN